MSNIAITIKTPCEQNYATMHVSNRGRFCEACDKEVIDFTTFSTTALIAYFDTNKGKVCGRVNKTQLLDPKIETGNHTLSRKIAVFVAASLAFLTSKPTFANVNELGFSNTYQTDNRSAKGFAKQIETDTTKIKIAGKVLEQETNQALPGVVLKIKGTNIVGSTDENGKFNFTYHGVDITNLILQVMYIGFNTIEHRVVLGKPQEIILKPSDNVLMGEVVITRKYENFYLQIFQKLKNWFR